MADHEYGAHDKRNPRTTEVDDDEAMPMTDVQQLGGAQELFLVQQLCWKGGVEPPPFVSTNSAAIKLLQCLFDGTLDEVPSIAVSEAVALQIYWLVFGKEQRETGPLTHMGWTGLFLVLASLTLGTRVSAVDPDALKRLKTVFERKKSGRDSLKPLNARAAPIDYHVRGSARDGETSVRPQTTCARHARVVNCKIK